jgi:hypothetical protein
VYSIDILFYFDDVNASFNTFQKIIDFKNARRIRAFTAAASQQSLLPLAPTGSGDPHAGSGIHDFSKGTIADLLVISSANGVSALL